MRHFLLLGFVTALFSACGPVAQKKCDTTNCSGCCDAFGECQPGFAGSACGAGGLICQTCPSGQCSFGICSGSSSGGGSGGSGGSSGGGSGGGASGGGTGGGASGGGTGGGSLGGGAGGGTGGGALGGGSGGGTGGGSVTCSPSNCGGCCDTAGFCQPGSNNAACGTNGGSCLACGATMTCQAGRCSSTGGGAGGGTGGGAGGGAVGGGAGGGATGGGTGGGAAYERNGLRLVGGPTANGYSGRVEVFANGAWGTVCDDSFDQLDATVVCRQLGFASAVTYSTVGGMSPLNILLDDLACVGTESTLLSCQNPGVGVHNCSHSEDVGVECSNAPPVGGGAGGGTGGGGGSAVCTLSPGPTCPASLSWSSYSTPSIRPSGAFGLGACDAWLVGNGVLHWDGVSWQPSTGTGAAQLMSVWAYDANTAFATGSGGAAYRYNGSSWSFMPGLPAYSFYSVWGTSPSEVWVGGYNGSTGVAALYRWNGTSWSPLPNPRTDNFGFFSVWASSATNLWTADTYFVYRWNGSSWTSYQPGLTTNTYGPVWGSGANDVWVVERTGASSNRMQRWNGSTWTPYTIPLTQQIVQLIGTSANDVWAVDYQGNVAQFCGSAWSYRGQLPGSTVGGLIIPTNGARWGVSGASTPQLYLGL